MANDSEILALIYDRNEQGLEMLQSEYGAYCMTIAMNILGSTEDAEECVNDAIFAVWKNTTQVRPQNLKIYIGRIVRNIAITRYRANNSQKRGGEYASAVCELGEVCYGSFEKGNYTELHKMSGSVPSPEEEVLFSELENALRSIARPGDLILTVGVAEAAVVGIGLLQKGQKVGADVTDLSVVGDLVPAGVEADDEAGLQAIPQRYLFLRSLFACFFPGCITKEKRSP